MDMGSADAGSFTHASASYMVAPAMAAACSMYRSSFAPRSSCQASFPDVSRGDAVIRSPARRIAVIAEAQPSSGDQARVVGMLPYPSAFRIHVRPPSRAR